MTTTQSGKHSGKSTDKVAHGSAKSVKITLVKSIHGQLRSHQACVRGLGLRHIRDSAVVADTPENRGMIRAATHLLKIEEAL